MQKHGELPCYSDHRAFLSVLATRGGPSKPPAPQIRIRAAETQDVVRSLHEQPAKIPVSSFGDPQLWLLVARLASRWRQPQIRAYCPTLLEALRVPQGKYEGQGCERANAGHLLE